MARKSDGPAAIEATFFATPAAFRRWLEKHHASAGELWVGFHKKATGKPSITWPESVDQALCFGWIDGLRKSIDADRYMIRFTPRRTTSIWSAVNTKRAQELIDLGLMQAAGAQAFAGRDAEKTNRYSFERDHVELDAAMQKEFRAHREAWLFFQSQPPSYRKMMTWWVQSAKRETTRARRLAKLIADSAAGQRIDPMRPGRGAAG
jgi:uncharacterized protein YdeI (YjbR/CyaY-like superfamily)